MSAPSTLAREGEGKRALITGLHGFTGQYVAAELRAAGYHVLGTALRADPANPDLIAIDLRDRDAVLAMVRTVQPDVVVHLAGIAFPAHQNVEQIYTVNLVATRHLLEALAALERKPSCVLLASSANIYGNAAVEVIDETVPPAPANDYAVSKLAMEYMARLFVDKLPIVLARPFNYTGVGQDELFLLPKIVGHFRRRAPQIELGNLNIARDFSDVRMVANAYRRLVAAAPAGEVFNVCSSAASSLQDVIRMMEDIAGYRIDVRVNPAFVRANDVLRLTGSHAKLERAIGPLAVVPLADTLRWMYAA
jgi:nucleoside-diphosphate-sugar epimerase